MIQKICFKALFLPKVEKYPQVFPMVAEYPKKTPILVEYPREYSTNIEPIIVFLNHNV